MKKVLLLGASGSIGSQVLDVISSNPRRYALVAFSVGERIDLIDDIIARFPKVKNVCIRYASALSALNAKHPKISFRVGNRGLIDIVTKVDSDLVVNALVGFVGLAPTVAALRADRTVCLANKETLVVGGEIVTSLLRRGKGRLLPIDSEHVALMKCLKAVKAEQVERLILTASGGALRSLSEQELATVTKDDALRHPTWKMGPKITIDSATMMNKGFELIEAFYLFGYPLDKIDIIMHDESMVHSLVELKNKTYVADVGKPDMHLPISFAMSLGKDEYELVKLHSFDDLPDYHFRDFPSDRYPCVGLAKEALKMGGTALAVVNAADEVAVEAFLDGLISYLDIPKIIALQLHSATIYPQTMSNVVQADAITRLNVKKAIGI